MSDTYIRDMLEKINTELQLAKQRDDELREAFENGNATLIRKVDAIQEKLEEMARGQLMAIIEQGERFMKELARSNSEVEMAINLEALRDTVRIDKKELEEILANAFGGNDEVKALVQEKFEELDKGLDTINENVVKTNDNVVNVSVKMDKAYLAIVNNGMSHFTSLKELILQTDKSVSDMSYAVKAIPTDRGLY